MARSTVGMGRQAIQRRRLPDIRGVLGDQRLEALRVAGGTLVWSRLLVWAIAVAAAALVGADAGNARGFDDPALTHPFGGTGDSLFSPLARWDAVWYLDIAHSGYDGQSTAFFPLYPLLVRSLAPGGSPGALLVMACALSLAALGGALYLFHRLVTLELGAEVARAAVALLALFPGALWLGAPYSESLFLVLSVGAFYAARTGRWAWAGGCAALASATRSAGVILVVPLLVLWWRSAPRRPRDLAWIALTPLGLALYSLYLAIELGDGFAYLHLQEVWFRSFAGPFGAIPDGAVAALEGVRQLMSGSRDHVYFTAAGGDPFSVAFHNVELFGFLLLAAVAVVGVLRRLPPAYGAYTLAALALPLSFPVGPQPLMSLPRFLGVLFPLFMWLALACRTPRRRLVAMAVLALGLGAFTARYATWHWVA